MSEGRTRILFVAESADWAGSGGDLLRVLPRLSPDRFAPVVVFPSEPGTRALRFQHEGAVVHSLGVPPASGAPFLASALGSHRLAKVLRDFRPDIAHGLDAPSSVLVAVAGRAAGVPILVGTLREHGTRPVSWARRGALRRLDRLVTPSEAMRADAARQLVGKHPPITVIPTPVELRDVRGFARAAEFSEPRMRVATCARVAADAGIEGLIEAALALGGRLPDLEWLVSGTGPDAIAWLRRTQREGLDGRVRLLGEREDLGPLLASADAYVEPGGSEAVPAGLLHGLAAGLPCVAVTNPSLEAMLRNGEDAILVPRGDPGALARAVESVLGDGGVRERLRMGAGRVAETCSADVVSSAVQALYATLIGEARRRSE